MMPESTRRGALPQVPELDQDTLAALPAGTVLYHNVLAFGKEQEPAECVVVGKMRLLPKSPERFALPVRRRYGDKAKTMLTWMSRGLWRLTKEPPTEQRIVRSRRLQVPSPVGEDVPRLRRTRRS